MTFDQIQTGILNTLITKYEEKGCPAAGLISVRPATIYPEYRDPFAEIGRIEWFEAGLCSLEQKGFITCSRDKKGLCKNIRLDLLAVPQILEALGRELSPDKESLQRMMDEDGIAAEISRDFYMKHPDKYLEEKQDVVLLSDFLKNRKNLLEKEESLNTRSFQVFCHEKKLSEKNGMSILAHCGIPLESLNTYATHEPLACASIHRQVPQNVLVVENSATYCTLLRITENGKLEVLGREFGTVIYGGGGGFVEKAKDFASSVEQYLLAEGNRFFYFGDLDLSGIDIYGKASCNFPFAIEPFVPAYAAMAEEILKYIARGCRLRKMPEGQRCSDPGKFLGYFGPEDKAFILSVLKRRIITPQEILAEDALRSR